MLPLTQKLLNTTALLMVASGLALAGGSAQALPQQGQVIGGQATITQSSPTKLTIHQTSNNAAIDWQSFSIAPAETTTFVQPGSTAVAINRVTGADPSQIEGHLNANGEVVLVNPNGVLFTKTATVNVGGLVASTSGISKANAIAGNLIFDQGSSGGASIVNQGSITAASGGLAALVSPSVVNSGVIIAKLGKVALASGDKWTLDLYGDNLVQFALNDAVKGQLVNSGTIQANGQSCENAIEISANVAKGVVSNVINMSGILVATGVNADASGIVLTANRGTIGITGTIEANGGWINVGNPGGTVTASGKLQSEGIAGGAITINGKEINLTGATIDTIGTDGGGAIAIGGKGTSDQAEDVTIGARTVIDTSATAAGNAGNVTIWSTDQTIFDGSILAEGGSQSGNGGTVNTGSATLFVIESTNVNTSAPHGTAGTWYIE